MDTRIGKLNNGQYYAFANGYDAPATQGTQEEVEIALGIRKEVSKPEKNLNSVQYREYEVSIITIERTDTLTIEALSRGSAISEARQWYKDEYNSPAGRSPAKYRARLAQ